MFLLLAACGEAVDGGREATADRSISVADDLGLEISLPRPASRVISLVPSATETLIALDARPQLVGRTRHDVAPEAEGLPSVGGMFDPSLETVLSLGPDLIVASADEKATTLRRRLGTAGVPVFSIDASDTTDILRTIGRLGRLLGRSHEADSLLAAIRAELAEVRESVAGIPPTSVLYVVWHDPPTIAGPDTYIMQVIGAAGGRAAYPDLGMDWPQVSLETIVRRQPEAIVVPVGNNPAHTVGRLLDVPGWRELRAVREGRVIELPADLVNRPGPHLAEAARRLRDALHPEAAR